MLQVLPMYLNLNCQYENRQVTELRSKVTASRYNADEMERKLAIILQELDKYSREVKVLYRVTINVTPYFTQFVLHIQIVPHHTTYY